MQSDVIRFQLCMATSHRWTRVFCREVVTYRRSRHRILLLCSGIECSAVLVMSMTLRTQKCMRKSSNSYLTCWIFSSRYSLCGNLVILSRFWWPSNGGSVNFSKVSFGFKFCGHWFSFLYNGSWNVTNSFLYQLAVNLCTVIFLLNLIG